MEEPIDKSNREQEIIEALAAAQERGERRAEENARRDTELQEAKALAEKLTSGDEKLTSGKRYYSRVKNAGASAMDKLGKSALIPVEGVRNVMDRVAKLKEKIGNREKIVAPPFDTKMVAEKIKDEIENLERSGVHLTQEQKSSLAQERFLEAKEKHQTETINGAKFYEKPFAKTSQWWADLEKTKKGKILKVAMSSALIGSATLAAGAGLGVLPTSLLGIGVKLVSRVGVATGLNMALTSNLPAKFLSAFKKDGGVENKKSGWKKHLNMRNAAMAGSVGFAFLMSGGTVAAIAAGGIISKKVLNAMADKAIERTKKEIEGSRVEFNVDALASNLEIFEKEYDDLAKFLKVQKRFKSLSNGTMTMAAGVMTMGAYQHHANYSGYEAIKDKLHNPHGHNTEGMSVSRPQTPEELSKAEQIAKIKEAQIKLEQQNNEATPAVKSETPNQTTEHHDNNPTIDKTAPAEQAGAHGVDHGQNTAVPIPKETPVETHNVAPAAPLDTTKITDEKLAENLGINYKDLIVHKGEGIEHSFIRQIEHDEELAKTLGWDGKEDLHHFAGHEAHVLALKEGYVDNNGHEVRVAEADKVAYQIRMENGHPVIDERTVDGHVVESHHEGDKLEEDGQIQKYEYIQSKEHLAENIKINEDNSIIATVKTDGFAPKFADSGKIAELRAGIINKIDGNPETPKTGLSVTQHFTDNPFHLSTETLNEVDKVYKENIEHFSKDLREEWSITLKQSPASTFMAMEESFANAPHINPLISYMHNLKEVTGLKPILGTYLTRAETNTEYITRALQKAAEMGQLDKVKE